MNGNSATVLSLFLLGGWILSGTWPSEYEGRFRFFTSIVDAGIESFGSTLLGFALIVAAFVLVALGRLRNLAERSET